SPPRSFFRVRRPSMWIRPLSWRLLALMLAGCGPPEPKLDAPPGVIGLQCVNPFSGARWDLPVDRAREFVDGFPARVGARHIVWREPPDIGEYDLDWT